jgi:hypothetical protein
MPYFIYHSELCRRLLVIIAAIYLMSGVYGHGLADAAGNRVNAVALEALLEHDTLAVRVSRDGLAGVIAYMQARPELFSGEKTHGKRLLTRPQREEIWLSWQVFLDHMASLDAIQQRHAGYREYPGPAQLIGFDISYAAFLAKYRFALDFIAIVENDPDFDILLNEPVPELGMPSRGYAKLKFHYLNVLLGLDFARLEALRSLQERDEEFALEPAMREDATRIWSAGKGEGPVATARNGVDLLGNALFQAYFPVQKQVSEWMGDVKVLRPGNSLISPQQVDRLSQLLRPGDILLERREWYLSNIGLPGFWSHAALYVGTAEERLNYFSDEDVQAWMSATELATDDFESLLRQRYPQAYKNSLQPDHGHLPRVIEAISEGVVFTTLEHTADADSLVVLRPRVSKAAKARAVQRAFHYSGRPYDFNFDFRTDEALVCTELIYKAYEPTRDIDGLRLPLIEVLGRPVTPANAIARQFDEEYASGQQQYDFIMFLDGQEHLGIAREAGIPVFRESWRRPKWHVVNQVVGNSNR